MQRRNSVNIVLVNVQGHFKGDRRLSHFELSSLNKINSCPLPKQNKTTNKNPLFPYSAMACNNDSFLWLKLLVSLKCNTAPKYTTLTELLITLCPEWFHQLLIEERGELPFIECILCTRHFAYIGSLMELNEISSGNTQSSERLRKLAQGNRAGKLINQI